MIRVIFIRRMLRVILMNFEASLLGGHLEHSEGCGRMYLPKDKYHYGFLYFMVRIAALRSNVCFCKGKIL